MGLVAGVLAAVAPTGAQARAELPGRSCGFVQSVFAVRLSYLHAHARHVSCATARRVANRSMQNGASTGSWSCYSQSADRFPLIERCFLDDAGRSMIHATVRVYQLAE